MLVRAVIFFSGNVAAVVCRNESPAQTSPHPLERGTGTQIQTMTIQRKLLGLTITGLAFVLAISATGYWGITTVEETTAEVAATGSAIRNHVEAGVYTT